MLFYMKALNFSQDICLQECIVSTVEDVEYISFLIEPH